MLDGDKDPKFDEPEPKRRRKLIQTVSWMSEGLEAFGENFKEVEMRSLEPQNNQLRF